jgi:hypothetical protein
VLVTVEWRIDPAEFAADAAGRAGAPQTGATRLGLFQDAADPALFLETLTVSTWSEHLRQHLERGIASDKDLEDRARVPRRRARAPGSPPALGYDR